MAGIDLSSFTSVGLWLILIAIASFNVIGMIEGVKSVVDSIKNKTGMWWCPVLSFVLSFLVAWFLGSVTDVNIFSTKLNAILFGGATIFALCEVFGYNMIIKWLYSVFDYAIASFTKKAADKEFMTPEVK